MSRSTQNDDEASQSSDQALSWEQLMNLPSDSMTDLDADEQMFEQLGMPMLIIQGPVDYQSAQKLVDLEALAGANPRSKTVPGSDELTHNRDDGESDPDPNAAPAAIPFVSNAETDTLNAHIAANRSTAGIHPSLDYADDTANDTVKVPHQFANFTREEQIEMGRKCRLGHAFDDSQRSSQPRPQRSPTYSASPLGDKVHAYQRPPRSPSMSPVSPSSSTTLQHIITSTSNGATAPSIASLHLKGQRDLLRNGYIQQLQHQLRDCYTMWTEVSAELQRQDAQWRQECAEQTETCHAAVEQAATCRKEAETAQAALGLAREQGVRWQDEAYALKTQLERERFKAEGLESENASLRADVDRMRPAFLAETERAKERERQRESPEGMGPFVPTNESRKHKESIEREKRVMETPQYRQGYDAIKARIARRRQAYENGEMPQDEDE